MENAMEPTHGAFTLPYRIKRCDTFGSRLLGLMFRRRPLIDEAYHLIPCNSVHTFFMQFPIDVLFLDAHGRVLSIAKRAAPWRVLPPVRGAASVLELPAGAAETHRIEIGQIIEL
ncbi:DUF192 domain-containing protein [Paenibacillus sp.]|uniref:DUF192 domain-containing protein n=1 Tax=Paenibacillus sp. TaxID=58172 RepID=UPI002D636E43|nr:DUF192 domain-containing protein [Paenibacillus sp.]HZG85519.1 DUF192 domain-containing protein [Paenibacillus sp.]